MYNPAPLFTSQSWAIQTIATDGEAMSLNEEIAQARKEIVSDGYEMSIGELLNLYRDGELQISPAYQRLFRWDITRKTRFIESALLGLPLPPIFVYQQTSGVWELIDGLQRVSTLLEFVGILRGLNGHPVSPLKLEGTAFLPSLANQGWEPSGLDTDDGIGSNLQIQLKRCRMRVEILKQESDPQVKYELFQRLNTGGLNLSEQEVRNSVAIMIDPQFHEWITDCAEFPEFATTTAQTDYAIDRQAHVELALRYFAFRNCPYDQGLDVHEYLDKALVKIANDPQFDRLKERQTFEQTFALLDKAMGPKAFTRWDGEAFTGKFLMSVFEVVALGVSKNIDAIDMLPNKIDFVQTKCRQLWEKAEFTRYSGAGVRGTTRLSKLLPLANAYFQP